MFDTFIYMTISLIPLDLPDFGMSEEQPKIESEIYLKRLRKFKNDFDILSVLRNLKILGIFTRLAKRDKKYNYLKLISYAWKLIELRTRENLLLKDLKIFLDKNFSKKIFVHFLRSFYMKVG